MRGNNMPPGFAPPDMNRMMMGPSGRMNDGYMGGNLPQYGGSSYGN
jgi:hypothetical protein